MPPSPDLRDNLIDMVEYAEIAARLAPFGMMAHGAFHPEAGDEIDGVTAVLVGYAGPAMWRAFREQRRHGPDPLDNWTREVLQSVAAALGARVMFPFGGPPFLPFGRWAERAGGVHRSPIGILIHPEFGLWHGYRGLLAFADLIALPPVDDRPSPCESCADKPCLSACPVDAFAPGAYDVAACKGHIARPAGADCMGLGCRARRDCPVGTAYHYRPEQAEFHMRAFLGRSSGET